MPTHLLRCHVHAPVFLFFSCPKKYVVVVNECIGQRLNVCRPLGVVCCRLLVLPFFPLCRQQRRRLLASVSLRQNAVPIAFSRIRRTQFHAIFSCVIPFSLAPFCILFFPYWFLGMDTPKRAVLKKKRRRHTRHMYRQKMKQGQKKFGKRQRGRDSARQNPRHVSSSASSASGGLRGASRASAIVAAGRLMTHCRRCMKSSVMCATGHGSAGVAVASV